METKVKCPYCGYENNIEINPENRAQNQIVLCDYEGGGCDKYFVAFTEIAVQTEGKRIEGC